MSIHSLLTNSDIDGSYDEIKLLIGSDRSILQSTDRYGILPIHFALSNPHITLRIIKLLLDSWPESISQPNHNGELPIHLLCSNKDLDEAVLIEILHTLLEASPGSVQQQALDSGLPIHHAAALGMSPNFLKILVQAYPESVRIPFGDDRELPIHLACESDNSRLDSVEYLLDIYPESIDVEANEDWLPIHYATYSKGSQKADIIKYLLSKDPDCASKITTSGRTPLHWACRSTPNNTVVQLLFDSYPWAFVKRDNEGRTPLQCAMYMANNSQKAQVVNFLQAQQFYVNSSPESLAVQDKNGLTPLHHALKNNAPLGSIKLLVKKSTSITQIVDRNNAFPLHIACEFSSVEVVRYLMEMHDEHTRSRLDVNKDSILHYACRRGNCEVVKYLLDEQSQHVIERNVDGKLPIHLMCESGSSITDTGEGDRQTNTGEDIVNDIAWICDICQVAKFRTLDEAEAHEEMCSGPVFDSVRAFNDLDQTDTIYRLLLAFPGTVKDFV